MTVTYDHHRLGTITARPVTDQTTQADWIAVKMGSGDSVDRVYGYVVDTRADARGTASEIMPADDDARPFDSFDKRGQYITCTHSLRGALLAIGNQTQR